MGRIYCKIIIISISFFLNSCAFDPPNGKLLELGKDYYASYNKPMSNDGIEIMYSKDKETFKILASNCINIYRDSNFIFYSKTPFEEDTINIEYYTFEIKSKSEIKQINKFNFEKETSKLEKIQFSR